MYYEKDTLLSVSFFVRGIVEVVGGISLLLVYTPRRSFWRPLAEKFVQSFQVLKNISKKRHYSIENYSNT